MKAVAVFVAVLAVFAFASAQEFEEVTIIEYTPMTVDTEAELAQPVEQGSFPEDAPTEGGILDIEPLPISLPENNDAEPLDTKDDLIDVSSWDFSDVNASRPELTCGGNCPSNDCNACPCGTSVQREDIATWCAKGPWNQKCCQCIVSHESGGNKNAANQNSGGSFDIGFWQINSQNWASCSGGQPPCDMNTNLNCAIKVWQWGGNSFKLWSTCGGCGCC